MECAVRHSVSRPFPLFRYKRSQQLLVHRVDTQQQQADDWRREASRLRKKPHPQNKHENKKSDNDTMMNITVHEHSNV